MIAYDNVFISNDAVVTRDIVIYANLWKRYHCFQNIPR
jgi:hypothetical protein